MMTFVGLSNHTLLKPRRVQEGCVLSDVSKNSFFEHGMPFDPLLGYEMTPLSNLSCQITSFSNPEGFKKDIVLSDVLK